MSGDLGGPVAVVTGGTRGIGAATSRVLARSGHDLCLGYRSRDSDAEDLASSLREDGAEVRLVRCDVGSGADVERLFAAADETHARGAGQLRRLAGTAASMVDIDAERWTRVLAVNVVGAALCRRQPPCAGCRPRHGGRGGAIVNLSSRAARARARRTSTSTTRRARPAVDTLPRSAWPGEVGCRRAIRVDARPARGSSTPRSTPTAGTRARCAARLRPRSLGRPGAWRQEVAGGRRLAAVARRVVRHRDRASTSRGGR